MKVFQGGGGGGGTDTIGGGPGDLLPMPEMRAPLIMFRGGGGKDVWDKYKSLTFRGLTAEELVKTEYMGLLAIFDEKEDPAGVNGIPVFAKDKLGELAPNNFFFSESGTELVDADLTAVPKLVFSSPVKRSEVLWKAAEGSKLSEKAEADAEAAAKGRNDIIYLANGFRVRNPETAKESIKALKFDDTTDEQELFDSIFGDPFFKEWIPKNADSFYTEFWKIYVEKDGTDGFTMMTKKEFSSVKNFMKTALTAHAQQKNKEIEALLTGVPLTDVRSFEQKEKDKEAAAKATAEKAEKQAADKKRAADLETRSKAAYALAEVKAAKVVFEKADAEYKAHEEAIKQLNIQLQRAITVKGGVDLKASNAPAVLKEATAALATAEKEVARIQKEVDAKRAAGTAKPSTTSLEAAIKVRATAAEAVTAANKALAESPVNVAKAKARVEGLSNTLELEEKNLAEAGKVRDAAKATMDAAVAKVPASASAELASAEPASAASDSADVGEEEEDEAAPVATAATAATAAAAAATAAAAPAAPAAPAATAAPAAPAAPAVIEEEEEEEEEEEDEEEKAAADTIIDKYVKQINKSIKEFNELADSNKTPDNRLKLKTAIIAAKRVRTTSLNKIYGDKSGFSNHVKERIELLDGRAKIITNDSVKETYENIKGGSRRRRGSKTSSASRFRTTRKVRSK